MIKKPVPIPLAMVVCDTVIEDSKTGKKSLIGIFNNIHSPSEPCIHPVLNVFLALTEGIGEYKGVLRCIPADDGKRIFEMSGPVVFSHPHQTAEFNFSIHGVKFPVYGEYRFEFLCDGKLVCARKLRVSPVKEKIKEE